MAEAILHKPLGENSNAHPQVINHPGWSIKPLVSSLKTDFNKRKINIELQFRTSSKVQSARYLSCNICQQQ